MRNHAALLSLITTSLVVGCGNGPESKAAPEPGGQQAGYLVRDTTIATTFAANGIAEPMQRSVLSTRVMGNVLAVLVHEGDRVAAGQSLLRLDPREIDSKRSQLLAGAEAARAVYQDANTQAERFRRLYQDSAATRYQLDQAETGLARAAAGLKTAEAGLSEVNAIGSYTEIRAPFSGVITRRMTDPGGFAAPGTPLIEVQDPSTLRVSVSVPPAVAASLKRGHPIAVEIEGRKAEGAVEGLVPSSTGAVYRLNVLVPNRQSALLVGGSAVVEVPTGSRRAILLPERLIVREGDLTGVRVISNGGKELRWIRLGAEFTGVSGAGQAEPLIEILSGVAPGEAVVQGES